jgi:hypothetical protein
MVNGYRDTLLVSNGLGMALKRLYGASGCFFVGWLFENKVIICFILRTVRSAVSVALAVHPVSFSRSLT